MTTGRESKQTVLVVLASLLATALIYWPGLRGPLLFDDFWNLAPVARWARGEQNLLVTLLPNAESVIFSRPVSMASFMLSTWLGGTGTFPLKLGNLIVHLACGLLAFGVLHRALVLDPRAGRQTALMAAVLMLAWLIHPLHVSTVLYAVQRMAQLSTFFVLLAVTCYLSGRSLIDRGRNATAYVLLFVGFPASVLFGLLSKQNALVAPLLCLVFELAYFTRPKAIQSKVRAFFGMFLVGPGLAATALFALDPERLMVGYGDLEFGPWERMLSQPRALADYVAMLLVPRSAQMGLYTDDFATSTSLFDPVTTTPAILLLLAICALAIRARRVCPSFFAGWFFFLGAHSIESSFLPLELYYEHRNYLPSLGLLLAVAGLASLAASRLRARGNTRRTFYGVLGLTLLLTLAFATHSRVLVWQSEHLMTEQGMRHHPDSIRVHLDRLALGIRNEDAADVFRTLDAMEHSDDPRQRLVGRMDRVAILCMAGEHVDPAALMVATRDARPVLTVHEVHVAQLQEAVTREGACSLLRPSVFADSLVRLMDAATGQPESASNKSTIRRLAAQLYARDGDWRRAEDQALIGWRNLQTMPLGVLLTRAYIVSGKLDEARETLGVLRRKVRPFDTAWRRDIELLQEMLDKRLASPAADPRQDP